MTYGDDHNAGKLVSNHSLYREKILAEQVRQLYNLAPFGFLATFINSLIVFFIMKDVTPYSLLVPWLAAVLTITSIRVALVLWFRSSKLEPATVKTWQERFLISLVCVGLAWGSIGFLPFSNISLAHQVFIAFVLGGMAAGASSTFSMLKAGYIAYSVPSLAPLTLHFFLLNDPFHYAMGAMLSLFGVLLWRISLHNYSINWKSLLLRFENLSMIESLNQAKERVEGLNSQLTEQIDAKLQAEAELRAQHDLLERTVEERTRDLVQANEQLSTAKEAAESANIAKSEFLANMSHEMRTPLAGTLGMINLVLEMEIAAEERQLLEMARRSADSLLPIISDVLDFSRLEAGVMRFKEEDFDLSKVVRTAVEVVSLTAAEKNIALAWKVDESVPEHMIGDEGRLRQVLVNLLGNALKFTEAGRIEVMVRDTGVGIAADQMERIFGKFTQVDSTLTRRHGGTGLGLALTRQIVENWGGKVWAESTVGAGSTFYFTLPMYHED